MPITRRSLIRRSLAAAIAAVLPSASVRTRARALMADPQVARRAVQAHTLLAQGETVLPRIKPFDPKLITISNPPSLPRWLEEQLAAAADDDGGDAGTVQPWEFRDQLARIHSLMAEKRRTEADRRCPHGVDLAIAYCWTCGDSDPCSF